MSKLSMDALGKRAIEGIDVELLKSISGGIENACHDKPLGDITSDAFGESDDEAVLP